MFVVPKDTTDECIRKNARCHKLNRLPIIVWRNPVTNALLLRSSSFNGKSIIAMLMKGQTTSSKPCVDLLRQTTLFLKLNLQARQVIRVRAWNKTSISLRLCV